MSNKNNSLLFSIPFSTYHEDPYFDNIFHSLQSRQRAAYPYFMLKDEKLLVCF
jgi:hypothetical protein